MSQSDETRAKLIATAAELFNQKGFAGVAMSDVMAATGLQKGGIYNHFKSKEDLAIAAFDYAVGLIHQRYRRVLRVSPKSIPRLFHFIELFCQSYDDPPLNGGCPIMNTAIEQDSTQDFLRDRARRAMDDWRDLICKIVARGIAQNEIQAIVHPDEVATLMIATLEGALMMSQLYQDSLYLERAADSLKRYLQDQIAVS